MSAAMLGGLALLALVDSTSFGTLLIPLWMLLAPRLRVRSILLYLATVAVFYAGVGVLLLLGIDVVTRLGESLEGNRVVDVVQLGVGVALFAWSFRFPWGASEPTPRARRWQATLQGDASPRTVVAIALTAVLLEVATMLPYIAAMGLLSRSSLGVAAQLAVLVGYVVVMLVPALAALVLRLLAGRWVQPQLERLGEWLATRAGSMVGWVVGIVGFLLAADAANRLFGT